MKLVTKTQPHKIIADEGKHIRAVNDVYVAEHTDEEGNIVPEHFPYYATTIFVSDSFTEEQVKKEYVEEVIK